MSVEQEYSAGPVETVPHDSNQDGSEGSGGPEFDENGQRVPHGLGQSKSSRRRRRKRKGKGPEAGASDSDGASQGVGGEVTSVQAAGDGQPAPYDTAPASIGQAPQQAPRQSSTQNGQGRNFAGQQQTGQQNGQQQNGQNSPGGTKRWKKKFRDRDRQRPEGISGQPGVAGGAGNGGSFQAGAQGGGFQGNGGGGFRGPDTHQPGNSVSGFKRKGSGGSGGGKQQRSGGGGSRGGFVGPMDHSYRVVNGNVFDPSQSTINPYGNGNGGGRGRSYSAQSDSQPIDYSQGRAIPIAEDAPTKIYFFIDDLFFTAKIQETARKMGVKVAFIKNEKEQIAALTSAEEQDRPGLIVFDLNNANAKPMTLIPKLKAKLKKSTSIVGFLSHLQGDLKAKAIEVGCDTVMPRAAFSQNLPNLLRRYGIEEVEEANFNQ
jgi:hypothetical protein